MNALVVGLGSIGTRHFNNLHKLGIKDVSVLRMRRGAPPPTELLSTPKATFSSLEDASRASFDLVVVANPSSHHLPVAKWALERGSHVYLEKPVSDTLEGTDELLELSRKKKLVVQVGCQLRFHPTLLTVKKWLDEERVGRVFSTSADVGEHLPSWHPWEDYRESYAAKKNLGGGVILTLIHELDYLYWFFGAGQKVSAIGGHFTPLELEVEDTALISYQTEKSGSVQLRMDFWRDPPVRTCHIVGERGEIFWDYHKGTAELRKKDTVLDHAHLPNGFERNDLFLALMQDFLSAIQSKRPPKIPLEDGIEVLKTALTAKSIICQ